MRPVLPLTIVLLSLPACVVETSPDDPDAVGVTGGKADGSEFSECELAAVVEYLNAGVPLEELERDGVHALAAEHLVAHRDGPDGLFGTEDDDLFDDIAEVDDVLYVGPVAMQQLVAIVAEGCAGPADPWAAARDASIALVSFPDDLTAERYDYPAAEGFRLSGTEFWQKWSGGHNPTYSFSAGTDLGRRCMQASAYRFEAIMADPPEALVRLRDESNWSGSFFNWNDDYSESTWSDGSGARLWAWRTTLIKWISQTNRDGSCWLPTRELVERAAESCLATAERGSDGEIQGCSAR
jgi:hypothetical protein